MLFSNAGTSAGFGAGFATGFGAGFATGFGAGFATGFGAGFSSTRVFLGFRTHYTNFLAFILLIFSCNNMHP